MKKYFFIIPLMAILLLGNSYAADAAGSCCEEKTCACSKGECCKDGKCMCKGDCCSKGKCVCKKSESGKDCTCKRK